MAVAVIAAGIIGWPTRALTGEPTGEQAAHPSDSYFELDNVLDVEIELAAESWDSLRVQKRTLSDILNRTCGRPWDDIFSWFRATVSVDGEVHAGVGVRKKGFFGSLSDTKPALKIRFDKFVDGQKLGGVMRRLTLNNVLQDQSMINTCMAYHVFSKAGLPAPRCNFATVSVNGEDLGLFVHVESIKADFLERHFSDAQGHLYEGTLSDFRPGWRGTFEKKTNEDANWADIAAVSTALKDPSPAGLEALSDIIDIDRFLSFWAAEVVIGHWDGYAGNRNNYYIYRRENARFCFIPWGADAVFSSSDVPFDRFVSPESVLAHGAIAHRLYQDEAMRQRYSERLLELLNTVWNEAELLEITDRMAAIVQRHILAEEAADAASDAKRVRRFISQRRAAILAESEPSPPEWPWPLSPAFCRQLEGAFDLLFDTTWGSLGRNPGSEGTVSFSKFQRNGETRRIHMAGAIAGAEGKEGTAASRATLIVVGVAGDSAHVLTASLPAAAVSSGSRVSIDGGAASGLHMLFQPPYEQPEVVETLGKGAIEFSEAVTTPGGRVSGRFHAAIFSTGVEAPAGLDDLAIEEVRAEIGVVINEVAAQGDSLDWFELYNATDAPIELGDFLFADDLDSESKRVPFPAAARLEPGAYLQIQLDKGGWPGFALGRGEALGIWTVEGQLVARIDWEAGQADEGTSFARVPDIKGEFQTVGNPTPGAPNSIQTLVAEEAGRAPATFRLRGNWPNPFNASTAIAFDLPRPMPVSLVVHDVLGRPVRTLHRGQILAAGLQHTTWDGRDGRGRTMATGIYLYELRAGDNFTAVGRMALIR